MIGLQMTFKEAIQFLEIPEDEEKEIEEYFKSQIKKIKYNSYFFKL